MKRPFQYRILREVKIVMIISVVDTDLDPLVYPCADKLSAFMKVCMWDGFVLPLACMDHRHINHVINKTKQGPIFRFVVVKGGSNSKPEKKIRYGAEIGTSDEEESSRGPVAGSPILRRDTQNAFKAGVT